MNIRVVCRDGENTKPKQCWVPSSTGKGQSSVSPPELRLHCSSREDRQGLFMKTRDFLKDAGKTTMLMDMK